MEKLYTRRFEKISQQLSGEKIKVHARLPGKGERTFTRDRKMPLQDIILCCLAKKGLTTVFELRKYFQQRNPCMKISKQGYLQQRKRLNPDIFSTLNDEYLIDFYESGEAELWNGYLLLAIDGSKAEVPNSQENRECFGAMTNQHTDTGPVRAMVSGMYDILNGFYLDIEIAHISSNEGELAKQNLRHLQSMGIKQPVLVIFDRGYPSLELIDFLEEEGFCYIFRLASNDYRMERNKLRSADEIVTLTHTEPRLRKIRRNHPEHYESMRAKSKTTTRLITCKLPTDKDLTLITNLSSEFTKEQLQNVYYQRWEIEKKYHTLKNKIKFESVTGKAAIYVYQDFRAQVLVYNMVQDIRRYADSEVRKAGDEKGLKYPVQTNENIAIGLFKEQMIKIVLEKSPQTRAKLLHELQSEMEQYVLPVRDLPGHERKKCITNKYQNNQKHSF